jgi:hypothetical protein
MNTECLTTHHLITGQIPDPWHSCVQLFERQDLELFAVDDGSSELQFPIHSRGHVGPTKKTTSSP